MESIPISEQSVFIARHNSWLIGIDQITGDEKWRYPAESRSKLSIGIEGDTILLGEGNYLSAINADTGRLLWQEQMDHGVRFLAVDDHVAYLDSYGHPGDSIIAYDLRSRRRIWQTDSEISEVNCIGDNHNNLFISGNGLAILQKTNGKILWENKRLFDLTCPVQIKSKVYLRKSSRNLYAFDQTTGRLLAQFPIQWGLFISPLRNLDPIGFPEGIIVPTRRNQITSFSVK